MQFSTAWWEPYLQLLTLSGVSASELFSGLNMEPAISNPSFVQSAGGNANCITGNLWLPVTGSNRQILVSPPADQYQTTELFVEMQQANGNYSTVAVGGAQAVSSSFNIWAKLCIPSTTRNLSSITTLQVLTHGATLDHTYWDTAPGYSYVDAAASSGYATLSYDRLGTGLSDHPDPLQIVQAPIQVEVIHALITIIRAASFNGNKLQHVVGVGHSAGSAIMQGVTTKYPADFDAIALTGTSTSLNSLNAATAGFATELARLDPSGRFSELANGYFSQGAVIQAVQFSFWRYPHFETSILQEQFDQRQTNTLGELLTLGSMFVPSTSFTGPVAVIDGMNDFVFCGGDCSYPVNQAQLVIDVFYPAASKSGSLTFLQPDSGHVIAQHYNAQQGYNQTIQFFRSNGIV